MEQASLCGTVPQKCLLSYIAAENDGVAIATQDTSWRECTGHEARRGLTLAAYGQVRKKGKCRVQAQTRWQKEAERVKGGYPLRTCFQTIEEE